MIRIEDSTLLWGNGCVGSHGKVVSLWKAETGDRRPETGKGMKSRGLARASPGPQKALGVPGAHESPQRDSPRPPGFARSTNSMETNQKPERLEIRDWDHRICGAPCGPIRLNPTKQDRMRNGRERTPFRNAQGAQKNFMRRVLMGESGQLRLRSLCRNRRRSGSRSQPPCGER